MSQHGYPRYREGCRCELCRRANTLRIKKYRLNGVQTIDPQPAREHVWSLIKAGMTQPAIAKLAGVSLATINRLAYPRIRHDRIRKDNADRILSVTPQLTWNTWVDATISRRKIRALMVMGWSHKAIGQKTGLSQTVLTAITSGRRKTILHCTKDKIDALYEETSMIHGPSSRTAKYGKQKKWLPPLAWDDIDDLEENPHWSETVHRSVITEVSAVLRAKRSAASASTSSSKQKMPTVG